MPLSFYKAIRLLKKRSKARPIMDLNELYTKFMSGGKGKAPKHASIISPTSKAGHTVNFGKSLGVVFEGLALSSVLVAGWWCFFLMTLSIEIASSLVRPFSLEEIKLAVWDCDRTLSDGS
ncbi:uncharacterized protein LOC110607861 [Manihot esculenta]|nr:uncharacterized protein LOC110607861 [Manihot esculenta]